MNDSKDGFAVMQRFLHEFSAPISKSYFAFFHFGIHFSALHFHKPTQVPTPRESDIDATIFPINLTSFRNMYYTLFVLSSHRSLFNGTNTVIPHKCDFHAEHARQKTRSRIALNLHTTWSRNAPSIPSEAIISKQYATEILTCAIAFLRRTFFCSLLKKTNAAVIKLVGGKDGSCMNNRIQPLLQSGPVLNTIKSMNLAAIQERIRVISADLVNEGLNIDGEPWKDATEYVMSNNKYVSFIHYIAGLQFYDPHVHMFPMNVLCMIEIIRLLCNCDLNIKNVTYVFTSMCVLLLTIESCLSD